MGYNCKHCSTYVEKEPAYKVSTILRNVKYDKMSSFLDRDTKRKQTVCVDSSEGVETVKEIVVCKDCVNVFAGEYEPAWDDKVKTVTFRYDKPKPKIIKKKKPRDDENAVY